jgi:large subunit ribosomal protein L21
MYAIMRSGNQQYRVEKGDVIRVALLQAEVGSEVEITDVLQVSADEKVTVGTPTVAGAKVRAKVLRHAKDKKILVYTYKRRKGYEKRKGHRQDYTEVRIEGIDC